MKKITITSAIWSHLKVHFNNYVILGLIVFFLVLLIGGIMSYITGYQDPMRNLLLPRYPGQ